MNQTCVIISPVRNEAPRLPLTIRSVAAQTVLPAQWILVDDGSADETPSILRQAAEQHHWITIVTRSDRGSRKPGSGVIEAFYEGYSRIQEPGWDYLVKLDGDVSLAPDYFESCFRKFRENPKLGIGGGLVCNPRDGRAVPESTIDPAFHVRGATKIYRRECWDQISPLIQAPGWDTLDELKANMLGWTTLTFREIPLLHHKPAGSADGSWANWVKNGLANYIVGYHPAFMLLKSLSRVSRRPFAIGGLGLLVGFLSGYLRGIPQIEDKALIAYLRKEQVKRLTLQPSLWN